MIVWLASYPKSGNTWVRIFYKIPIINPPNKTLILMILLFLNILQKRFDELKIYMMILNLNFQKTYKITIIKLNSNNKINF